MPALLALVAATNSPAEERRAAWGLGNILSSRGVAVLIEGVDDPAVAGTFAGVLFFITNHRFGSKRVWSAWFATHGDEPRMAWVASGFTERWGIVVDPANPRPAVAKLVELVRRGGTLGYHARMLIRHYTGYSVAPEHYSARQLRRFYRYWLRNTPRLGVARPP